jgi:hypothetical protein
MLVHGRAGGFGVYIYMEFGQWTVEIPTSECNGALEWQKNLED